MSAAAVGSVGVIGVGAMGSGVARRLLALGIPVRVRDISPQAQDALVSEGAVGCSSPVELARQARAIVVLVVDAAQIEAVLFGPDGAAGGLRPGDVVMLSSTIAPADAESFAERLGKLGVHALDAPVSGGPARAQAGTMSIMAAAPAPAMTAAAGLMEVLSDAVIRVSARPGDGARFKLLNNMLAATQLAAGAEVLALGLKMGLDGARLLDVIGRSSGASWVVGDRLPRALAGDYTARAATRILAKDVSLFTELARAEAFPTLVCSQTPQVFQAALAQGFAELDDACLLQVYQRLSGQPGQEPA